MTASPKTSSTPASLRSLATRRSLWLGAGIVILIALGTALIQIQAHQVEREYAQRITDQEARRVTEHLAFYRTILTRLAAREDVRDLLLLDNADEAQAWALRQRVFLPGSVGLALINQDMTILGTPVELRLGQQCTADLGRRLVNEHLSEPLVHDSVPELAHFDLTEPVTDGLGEPLGVVFASFRTADLHATLTQGQPPGEYLKIVDGQGQLITQIGSVPSGDMLSTHANIVGTDWHVELALLPHNYLNTDLSIALLGLLGGISLLLWFNQFIRFLLHVFSHELGHMQDLLERVRDGRPVDGVKGEFVESAELYPVIMAIGEDIQAKQQALLELSLTDDLTGLANRRRFQLEADYAFKLAERGTQICIVLIDIDHFKQLNDRYGHAAGDQALRALADCARALSRRSDLVARLGGDEFAIILSNTAPADAETWLRGLCDSLKSFQASAPAAAYSGTCTLSCGAAFVDPTLDNDVADVLRRADEALYAAKNSGRDRIEIRGNI